MSYPTVPRNQTTPPLFLQRCPPKCKRKFQYAGKPQLEIWCCGVAVLQQFGSAVLQCCSAAVKAKTEKQKKGKGSDFNIEFLSRVSSPAARLRYFNFSWYWALMGSFRRMRMGASAMGRFLGGAL